jgi:hypothetical protein
MIKVYFQSIAGSHSKLVAVFASEKQYQAIAEALEIRAAQERCIVTESVEDISQEISHLEDAIDELTLTMDIHDEQEQINAYNVQIKDLKNIHKLLNQLN